VTPRRSRGKKAPPKYRRVYGVQVCILEKKGAVLTFEGGHGDNMGLLLTRNIIGEGSEPIRRREGKSFKGKLSKGEKNRSTMEYKHD